MLASTAEMHAAQVVVAGLQGTAYGALDLKRYFMRWAAANEWNGPKKPVIHGADRSEVVGMACGTPCTSIANQTNTVASKRRSKRQESCSDEIGRTSRRGYNIKVRAYVSPDTTEHGIKSVYDIDLRAIVQWVLSQPPFSKMRGHHVNRNTMCYCHSAEQ